MASPGCRRVGVLQVRCRSSLRDCPAGSLPHAWRLRYGPRAFAARCRLRRFPRETLTRWTMRGAAPNPALAAWQGCWAGNAPSIRCPQAWGHSRRVKGSLRRGQGRALDPPSTANSQQLEQPSTARRWRAKGGGSSHAFGRATECPSAQADGQPYRAGSYRPHALSPGQGTATCSSGGAGGLHRPGIRLSRKGVRPGLRAHRGAAARPGRGPLCGFSVTVCCTL